MNMNKKDMKVLCLCWEEYIGEENDDVMYNHHQPEVYISQIWNESENRENISGDNVNYEYDMLNLLRVIIHKPKSAIVGVIDGMYDDNNAPFNIQCLILTYVMNENQYDKENKNHVELNNIWIKWRNKGR